MTMMVAEEKASNNHHPNGSVAEDVENTAPEPPPPGTEDVVLLSGHIDKSVNNESNAESSATGTENVVPAQLSANTLATNSSSVIDDDHEEGEIADDDEDQGTLQYENISSEEETNIRERIAMLEAMDDELRKIQQITGANNENLGHFACDRPSITDLHNEDVFECISDEEDFELYLRRYEPVPKPKLLPLQRRRKVRSIRLSGSLRYVGSSSHNRRHETRDMKRRAEKRKHEQMSARKSNVHRTRHKRRKQHMAPSTLVNIVDSTDSDQE